MAQIILVREKYIFSTETNWGQNHLSNDQELPLSYKVMRRSSKRKSEKMLSEKMILINIIKKGMHLNKINKCDSFYA